MLLQQVAGTYHWRKNDIINVNEEIYMYRMDSLSLSTWEDMIEDELITMN